MTDDALPLSEMELLLSAMMFPRTQLLPLLAQERAAHASALQSSEDGEAAEMIDEGADVIIVVTEGSLGVRLGRLPVIEPRAPADDDEDGRAAVRRMERLARALERRTQVLAEIARELVLAHATMLRDPQQPLVTFTLEQLARATRQREIVLERVLKGARFDAPRGTFQGADLLRAETASA